MAYLLEKYVAFISYAVVFNYGDPGLGVSPSLRSFVPSILPSFPQIHGKNLWEKLLEGFKSSNDLTCHMCYWALQYLEAFSLANAI